MKSIKFTSKHLNLHFFCHFIHILIQNSQILIHFSLQEALGPSQCFWPTRPRKPRLLDPLKTKIMPFFIENILNHLRIWLFEVQLSVNFCFALIFYVKICNFLRRLLNCQKFAFLGSEK